MLAEYFECLVELTLNGPTHFSRISGSVILFDKTIQFIGKSVSGFPRWAMCNLPRQSSF